MQAAIIKIVPKKPLLVPNMKARLLFNEGIISVNELLKASCLFKDCNDRVTLTGSAKNKATKYKAGAHNVLLKQSLIRKRLNQEFFDVISSYLRFTDKNFL